ncbi:hypothetical protein ABFB09_09210, partial [Dehalogenimonas sp. THU2]
YQKLKRKMKVVFLHDVADRRIFRLESSITFSGMVIEGQIEVGQEYEGQIILAIFDIGDWFAICTKTQGVLEGGPKYIAKDSVKTVTEFE